MSIFYVLLVTDLVLRVYVTIYINQDISSVVLINWLLPIVVKMSLGLVQISIIIEITVRVRESIKTLAVITNRKRKLNPQNMINKVLAN